MASLQTKQPIENQLGGSQSIVGDNSIDFFNEELPRASEFTWTDFQLTPEFFPLPQTKGTTSCNSLADEASFVFPSSSISIPNLRSELPGLDQTDINSSYDASTSSASPDSNSGSWEKIRKRSWQPQPSLSYAQSGLSEFSSTQRMNARMNSGLMSDNHMQLYHDVMEGALSCWLTEQNCPYLVPSSATGSSSLSETRKQKPFSAPSNLPNRIYRRVFKLDKSLSSLGLRPLSVSEDRKATKALHLAIMAFTAQWAQGSRRSQARYHQPDLFNERLLADGIGEEFDTALQVSFWNQARNCLDDCAGIDSFKVAMAELLFGLTQRHTDEPEWENAEIDRFLFCQTGEADINRGYIEKKVRKVLDSEGNSIYVERGARRLYVLKRRIDSFERTKKNQAGHRKTNQSCDRGVPTEEKTTMQLVFWLAIMFDTLSAAITERPLTVSDEDSKETNKQEDSLNTDPTSVEPPDEQWNDRYIIKRHQKLAPLRWPCSEEAASSELIDAAPVKVLLFRKITRIQSFLSRGASQRTIEDAVEDGLVVYRHWNMTYGPLFQDCIQYHDSLPPKIQSWYVCLLGHWLLAVMILADCIKLVDEQCLSVPSRASERTNADLVDHLQQTSMRAVSDLARVSTPREDDLGRLLGFHPAVNQGALLTEPWTMVLIRSFATAGTLLLDEATNSGKSGFYTDGSELELLSRCEDCVKALWYLGRKSSLSRRVAGILEEGLRAERSKMFNLEESLVAYNVLTPFDPVESFQDS